MKRCLGKLGVLELFKKVALFKSNFLFYLFDYIYVWLLHLQQNLI